MKMQKSKICKEKIENKYLRDKVRDHCHCKVRDHFYYTGENRGAAHSICYLKYSDLKKFL